ncbi:superoxide dismutase [Fundidesulfovibrio terrae]|uniref:superoxide dismutase n=1 Tax=Fundidesulfovibrio terrae TaxID=2922866 RepID=UPI001FAF852A|nr:superoxide dismutase [Fundidesulfovibrio terrae]
MSDRSDGGLTRREFNALAASAVAAAAFGAFSPQPAHAQGAPVFPIPVLPFPEDALEPVISAKTISFHYGKHTKTYYDNMNKMLEGKPSAGMTLEKVFLDASKDAAAVGLFNNAAQAWNHTFYFAGLKKGGGGAPSGKLGDAIKAAFGGFEEFKKAFIDAAVTQFGSGWAWLVEDAGTLKVVKTPNAMNPMVNNQKPILTVDVWEHAYYLDYQNRRADYVKDVLEKLVNWDVAAKNLG